MDQNNQGYGVQPNITPQEQPVENAAQMGYGVPNEQPQQMAQPGMPQAPMPGMPMGQPMGGFVQPGMPQQPQKNNNTLIIVIIVILVGVIGVLGYILLSNKDEKGKDGDTTTTTTTELKPIENKDVTTKAGSGTKPVTTTTSRASSNAEVLHCDMSEGQFEYGYDFTFEGGKVTYLKMTMELDGSDEGYTSEQLRAEAEMVKEQYEDQNFEVDYTITGTKIKFVMSITGANAVKAGLIDSEYADKATTKANAEDSGAICY